MAVPVNKELRKSHRQALRQLLERHGIGNLRQERGQLIDHERLIDEILCLNDRFTFNAGDRTYKP